MIRCPECGAEVQPTWDWCHVCGWDPDGLRPTGGAAGAPPPSRPAAGGPHRLAPGIDSGPGGAYAGYGRAPLPPRPPTRTASGGRTIAMVLLGVGGGFVALIALLVLVVALLGTPVETSELARVPGAEPGAGAGGGAGGGALTDANGVPVGDEWTRFTSADGTFSIDFPAAPTVEHPPNGVREVSTVEVTSAHVGTSEYAVVFLEFAPDVDISRDPATSLETYARTVNDSVGITVTSTTPGNYAYSTSVEYVGTSRQTGMEARGVVFLNARRLFLVMTVGDPAAPPASQRFLDSLTLG